MVKSNVKVRDIKDVSGEVYVAAGDIIKNIKTIYQIANGHLAVYLRPYHADPVEFIKRMFLSELTQAPALGGSSLPGNLPEFASWA